ncbi:MAG: hypothetical protein HYV06_04340 [Deltaproteobacteria bacterium]|nr:hypothetical protein [Deltaproteobacteria bacterium]
MWQREMVSELKEAKPSERKAVLKRYGEQYGYTKKRLYEIAGDFGFKSKRKTRYDKGIGVLAEEQIEFVASFARVTKRENKGAFAPVENAMEFAIDNGIMMRGEVTVGAMQRILREREMDKKRLNAPAPHTEMRSLHPNHVHLVDVSTCIQYYLDDGGMQIMREDEFYKNKFENFKKVKTPLQRYILTDHFSGFMFIKYYLSAGETAENLFDFLRCAWETKGEANFPFRGVPFAMLMDGGCRAKARAMGEGFWDGIGVEILPGTPGNSRRQGSVEVSHNIWEMWFETRLRIDPATTLDDLNRKARGFCIWMNATREHTRTRMTRLSCWLMIRQEQLRELPERAVLQDLMNKPEETRTVTNYRISFEGKEFNLKHARIPHGSKVKVIKNIWKWKDGIITVSYDNQLYEAQAIEKLPAELGGFSASAAIIGQQYKAQPETATQQAVKHLDELATGRRQPDKKAMPFAGLNAFEGFADKVGNLSTLPKRGTPIEVARNSGPAQIPIMELFKRLREAGTTITPALNRELRAEFGDSIEPKQAETVIEAIATGAEWRTPAWSPDDATLQQAF